MTTIVAEIPTVPDIVLSPNSRKHWRVVHRAKKKLRDESRKAMKAAIGATPINAEGFRLELEIAWPKCRRKQDTDNAYAMCKALIDGISDALGIDDKHLSTLDVTQTRSGANPGKVTAVVTLEGERT